MVPPPSYSLFDLPVTKLTIQNATKISHSKKKKSIFFFTCTCMKQQWIWFIINEFNSLGLLEMYSTWQQSVNSSVRLEPQTRRGRRWCTQTPRWCCSGRGCLSESSLADCKLGQGPRLDQIQTGTISKETLFAWIWNIYAKCVSTVHLKLHNLSLNFIEIVWINAVCLKFLVDKYIHVRLVTRIYKQVYINVFLTMRSELTNPLKCKVWHWCAAYKAARPHEKETRIKRNIAKSLIKSPNVRLNETSMVPKVSFAGIMNEILAMLRIIPAENMMSETSSGSGAQLGVQSAERQTVNRLICFPNENKEIKALSQLQL